MSNTQKTAWGFQSDTDDSLKSKQGGKFGLNNANITKMEYNPTAGKDDAAADAIDITVSVGDKEFRTRIYDITGDLFKGDNKVAPGEAGYDDLYNTEKAQREAVVVHAVKALGVTEAQIVSALQNGGVVDFKTWAIAMCSTIGADFATRGINVFVEYQWNIGEGNTMTFLQLPKNMKGGRFLSPAIAPVGAWTEVNDSEGLRYVDAANNEHPFTRSENYMGSNKAVQQREGEEDAEDTTTTGSANGGGGTAAKSTWG
tara:strand:- start:789 stop:1559 length:771 start_codon:yes stop_codon:yes gene_type:complete